MGMDCWDKEISLFSNNNSYSNNKYIENERKIGNTQYPLSFFRDYEDKSVNKNLL